MLNEKWFCRICNSVGVIIIIVCEYILWIKTPTFGTFLLYSAFVNIFGMLVGIPMGLMTGKMLKSIKWIRKEIAGVVKEEWDKIDK
jgi:hypothetical protein